MAKKATAAPSPSSAASERDDDGFMSATAFVPESVDDGTDAVQGAQPPASASAENSAIPPELIKQALTPTFVTLFNAVAKLRGPHWQLEEFEKEALVNGWTPILQLLLARLGNSEQVLLMLALGSTVAIVGGKIAQEVTKPASSTASTKTPGSAASPASSVAATPVKPPAPSGEYQDVAA